MNQDQFSRANEFGLKDSEKSVKNFENLASIVVKAVRLEDIHTARQDQRKYVMVFTDGQLNSGQDVAG